MAGMEHSTPLLEVIRHKEAEVKRQLAAEHEAAGAALAQAERCARDLLSAAEIEGRRAGEAQRQTALDAAEREAQAILARARAEAEALQRTGAQRIAAAAARAVEIVIGGAYETQDGPSADGGPEDPPPCDSADATRTGLRTS